jgi:hydroxyacylglutathione hydrolase
MIGAFAGWLLEENDTIALVADDAGQATGAAADLGRIGYDRIAGFLASPFPAWATEGRPFRSVPVVDVEELARRVADPPEGWTLLDVRSRGEVLEGIVEGAQHGWVGDLPRALDGLDSGRHYTTMCESGARATIAASVLLRAGFADVDVFVGSMGAWQAAGHPTVDPRA